MAELEIKQFDEAILEGKTLIPNNRINTYFDTYDLNDGNIMKVLKSKESILRRYVIFGKVPPKSILENYDIIAGELLGKILASREKDLPELVKPNGIYMGKDSIVSYTVPKVDSSKYSCLADIVEKLTPEEIADLVISLCGFVREANKQGIIIPDLCNFSNIFISHDGKLKKFIDYDGMQVDNFQTISISGFLQSESFLPCEFDFFFDKNSGLYTTNIDKFSLFIILINHALHTLVTHNLVVNIDYTTMKKTIDPCDLLLYEHIIGIMDTRFGEDFTKLLMGDAIDYPEEVTRELINERYVAVEDGKRKFKNR